MALVLNRTYRRILSRRSQVRLRLDTSMSIKATSLLIAFFVNWEFLKVKPFVFI